MKDEQLVGAGDTKNGVRGHLERLARTANWLGESFEKTAAKDAAKEYVEARQNASFKDDLGQKSTLRELKKVVDVNRVTLPEYLTRKCPVSLCHGRMLKTQLRLGTHQLASSKDRMIPRGSVGRRTCNAGAAPRVSRNLSDMRCLSASAIVGFGTTSSPRSAGRALCLGWRPTSSVRASCCRTIHRRSLTIFVPFNSKLSYFSLRLARISAGFSGRRG